MYRSYAGRSAHFHTAKGLFVLWVPDSGIRLKRRLLSSPFHNLKVCPLCNSVLYLALEPGIIMTDWACQRPVPSGVGASGYKGRGWGSERTARRAERREWKESRWEWISLLTSVHTGGRAQTPYLWKYLSQEHQIHYSNSHLLPDLQRLYYFVLISQLLIKLSPESQKDISVTTFPSFYNQEPFPDFYTKLCKWNYNKSHLKILP